MGKYRFEGSNSCEFSLRINDRVRDFHHETFKPAERLAEYFRSAHELGKEINEDEDFFEMVCNQLRGDTLQWVLDVQEVNVFHMDLQIRWGGYTLGNYRFQVSLPDWRTIVVHDYLSVENDYIKNDESWLENVLTYIKNHHIDVRKVEL